MIARTQSGVFRRMRVRLFGERDAVAHQLADIARQGSGMARLAHGSAFLLLLLFSLGSLVALGGDALAHVLGELETSGQIDWPAAISLAVSGLLVMAMDMAALFAALVIRLYTTRRAGVREYWIHVAVLVTACLLESSTYVYMSYLYERPTNAAAWALVIARAAAAPLLSVYLSLARPLPVTSRDILAQVELASGLGLLRYAVTVANDEGADLGSRAALFAATAQMTGEDRTRLDGMLRAIELQGIPVYVGTVRPPEIPPQLPTGGGTPASGADGEGSGPMYDSRHEAIANGHVVALPSRVSRRVSPARRRRASGRGVRTTDNFEEQARAAWTKGARSKVAMVRATGMGPTAAASWVRTLKAEERAAATAMTAQAAI